MTRKVGRGRSAAGGVAAILGCTVLAGCGSSGGHGAAPVTVGHPNQGSPTTTPATTGSTTAVATTTRPPAARTTTVPTTLPTAPVSPSTTTLVGLTLSGVGNTFTAPAAPTTKAYSPNCQALVDPGFYGQCVVVTAPTGTIAAIVEQQQQNYQPGQPITTGQERDLVYRKVDNTWSLVLRRTPVAVGESITQVYQSDIMRDGDPKAVFVEPATNSQYGNELDVVEGSGVVTLYRQLHGGFATVPATGGLDTYVPPSTSGYDETSIAYTAGAWKITSTSHVSDSQAKSLSTQAFYDPQEVQGTSG